MSGFSEFVDALSFDDLPLELLVVLRRSFLDTMGVAAIGSTTLMAKTARRVSPLLYGAGDRFPSRVLMDGGLVSPTGAAMAGAMTLDSVDAHDGTTPNKGHAGSAVFPALFAVIDALHRNGRQMSGEEFAVVLAIAYEVSYRAGQVQHATCSDYHTSGAWTAVGVAVACAKLLGCNPQQIAHAAGIGEYHGPRSQMMRCIDHPTMLRDGVGWGAPCGVSAAYLAQQDFTGAPALTCDSEAAKPYWSGLGSEWLTVDHTHYKLYPCCRWAHPSIDAVHNLMRDNSLTHQQIECVEIKTFHYATRLAGHEPANWDEFAYGIAFPVAIMIVRGKIGAEELQDPILQDPDILRISRATRLIDDPELTAKSIKKRWAQVTLITSDGRRLEDQPRSPRGDAEVPLSDEEISKKFYNFARPVLGVERSRSLHDLASTFDQLGTVEFAELLDHCLEGSGKNF
ncbi:MAG: MmgE/PrpD family protein [Rhizobiaceae bacterium]|nr:MmgE/PrpD family protein [Rhizobiaceae bacterium]